MWPFPAKSQRAAMLRVSEGVPEGPRMTLLQVFSMSGSPAITVPWDIAL